MKRLTTLAALVVLAALAACANPAKDKPQAEVGEAQPTTAVAAGGATYAIGEGSSIDWIGAKITGSHEGGFNTFDGTITVVDGDATMSSVKIEIDTTSLWSDTERLTGHLKSPDFFAVEEHPSSTFESTAIVADGDGYAITGNLDLHGVTKSITFPATIDVTVGRVTANAEFAIKRFDFDIEYKGAADDLIHDDVVIKFNLVALPAG